jgi:purine-binding chemotaxis protein CheW
VSVGLIVDAVVEVMYISSNAIENVSGLSTEIDSSYIQGVGKLEDRIVTLINLPTLLNVNQD